MDQESYSIAFEFLEKEFLNDNIWWMILLVIVLIIGIFLIRKYVLKGKSIFNKNSKAGIPLKAVFHPFEVYGEIKYKNQGSVVVAWIILGLFYVSLVSNNLWLGFMYQLPNPKFDAIYTLLGSVGVVLLWAIVQLAVTALFSGKGTLRQIFIVTCYSLLPTVAYKFFYLICSHVLVPSGTSMITLIGTIAILYSGIMMVIGMIIIHEYSLFKVVGISLLTVIGMMIVVFIIFMMLTLGQGCFAFVMNIISEILFR